MSRNLSMADKYLSPKLYLLCVDAEQGFSCSGTLDDMYETIGNWE